MNARRGSADGPVAGMLGGQALLAGAVVFAVAATGLLVLSDQLKWLRLGIVAALWGRRGPRAPERSPRRGIAGNWPTSARPRPSASRSTSGRSNARSPPAVSTT